MFSSIQDGDVKRKGVPDSGEMLSNGSNNKSEIGRLTRTAEYRLEYRPARGHTSTCKGQKRLHNGKHGDDRVDGRLTHSANEAEKEVVRLEYR